MKFRKLLAGAAVAALTAGTASALDLTLASNGTTVPGAAPVTTSVQPIGLALEGNRTAAKDTVQQILQVTTDATIAAANNYLITVTVSGGTFGRNVVGTDLINGTGVTFSGTNVQFDGSDRTGEEGDTSVRFLATNNAVGSDFRIRVPVKTDCSNPVTFTLRLSTEAGTLIEEGTATLTNNTGATATGVNSIVCVDAYSASIGTDVTATGANDSVVSVASTFQSFLAGVTGGGGAGVDTTATATLGVLTATFDPTMSLAATGSIGAGGSIFANLQDADIAVAAPVALTAIPAADAEFTLTTSSRTNISALNGVALGASPATSTAQDVDIVAGATPISATLLETVATTQPTTVTASAGTLNFDSTELLDEGIVYINSGVLDLINYQAGTCGNFDWVGDGTTSRRNVWRVTGATNAVANGVFATMSNSSAGLTANTLQISPAVNTAQEIIITDTELTTAFGNFGRADFTFSFAGDLTGFDCDRLMSSPAASIVTPFGNSTGVTPGANDGDD